MRTLLVVVLLCSCPLLALAADSPCVPGSSPGRWTKGIGGKVEVDDISKEIPAEFKDVISYLDKLPLDTNEKTLVAGVRLPLSQTMRILADSPMFEWEGTAKNSASFSIRVYYYKGCISQIKFITLPGDLYARRTKF